MEYTASHSLSLSDIYQLERRKSQTSASYSPTSLWNMLNLIIRWCPMIDAVFYYISQNYVCVRKYTVTVIVALLFRAARSKQFRVPMLGNVAIRAIVSQVFLRPMIVWIARMPKAYF